MREQATLKLDAGDEVRVEVDRDDLDGDVIVVRRPGDGPAAARANFLEIIDEYLATAKPHAAGTTDRLLAADRDRPY